MTSTVHIAGNIHLAALEAAYLRLARGENVGVPDASRLAQMIETFSLSTLEQELLLFSAAMDLAPAIPDALALLEDRRWPRVQYAYERIGRERGWLAFREALHPDASLRKWELLSLAPAEEPLPERMLVADSRVVDFLIGGTWMSPEAARVATFHGDGPRGAQPDPSAFQAAIRSLQEFARGRAGRRMFFVLSGGTPEYAESFAHAVLAAVGMPLLAIDAGITPAERTIALRESLLVQAGVLLHGVPNDLEWYRWLARATPIVFLARNPEDGMDPLPCPAALKEHAWVNLALPAQRAAQSHRLRELAQRIDSPCTWDDLIVPAETRALLEELCSQARFQETVFRDGGFARRLPRGRGTTGLFCGPSGTGKTLAAEVIAHELGRELYRVDLARVVSKYIGETEKSLRRIFDEAERAGCVVFFDEADALFGKRTEVRDSHDRYANLEVSYLLQLFEEAERAVILLASNRRQAIDEAFARRFRFVIEFAMPSAPLRQELWRSSFSSEIPLDDTVRIDVLAERLQLTGASIRNIALAAAFLAVADHGGRPGNVSATHLLRAAHREFDKLSSPMPLTLPELTAQKRAAR